MEKDWADEIAKAAFPDNDYSYFDNIRSVIAAELRKVDSAAELRGRANGMKLAAELIHHPVGEGDVGYDESTWRFLCAEEIRLAASKLSPTT